MNRKIDLQLGVDDLIAAYRANFASVSRRRAAIIPIAAALYTAGLVWMEGGASLITIFVIFILMIGAMYLGILLFRYLIRRFGIPRFAKRIYAQQADLRIPFQWEWDDDNFFAHSESGNSRYPWNSFHKWHRTSGMLLLYRSEVLFHFLPLRHEGALRAADDITARLTAHGIHEKKPKKS